MNRSRVAGSCLVLFVALTSCAPPRPFPPPVPSPVSVWEVTLSQSGGFAGINLQVRVDSDGMLTATDIRRGTQVTRPLSTADLLELGRLINTLHLAGPGGKPTLCADCFLYDLQITANGQSYGWRGDDTTLDASGAAELIDAVRRLRDESLSGGG